MDRRTLVLVGLAAALFVSCRRDEPKPTLDQVAERYVMLALAVGEHDPDYVDAYYGPEEWRHEAGAAALGLDEIRSRASDALHSAGAAPIDEDELVVLRQRFLVTQLRSLVARIDLLGGEVMSFDEESRALYDAVAPSYPEGHYQEILDRLDGMLPGEGSLSERLSAFQADFVIPPDRLQAVFDAMLDACRERTVQHLELPAGESFEVEYVDNRPWSAYNWYQGGFHSLIQVNVDLPIHIDRAIDLACHEGYPGHHVYNAMLEKHLVQDRGWIEFTIYPLFSPQSLIAEGTANYGVAVAFPGEERVAFERQVLFPLARLDPGKAELYYRIHGALMSLDHAGNDVARRYLEEQIDAATAARELTRFGFSAIDQAEQRVRFIDKYRSYVINYNLGRDLVQHYIDAQMGEQPSDALRWQKFGRLLASPRLPSDL